MNPYPANGLRPDVKSERGAILIFVGLSIFMLTAFSAFVLDYGVMWFSRRQAQNAADAGALAGVVSRLRDEFVNPPAAGGPTFLSARNAAQQNLVLGLAPGVNVTWTCPAFVPAGARCVRVDVYRDGTTGSVVLPAYFANLFGVTSQLVRATATARIASGNGATCMLPFAVIDRWADNFDDNVDDVAFPGDSAAGTDGWTPNDDYQPTASPMDEYTGPYGNNPAHTGWRVTTDYGRQLILKDGSPGAYSAGWANLVYLPGSIGANEVGEDISGCNEQPVGIATAGNACTAVDEAHGCIDIKTGVAQGPIKAGVNDLVGQDDAAGWDADAPGPNGPTGGAVVGGGGMDSPRIRPLAVVDINHYVASGCTGSTCIAKIANLIGFFVEGMCEDVTLDAGLSCDDPARDVVGRIIELPAAYLAGAGTVDESASFLKIISLVQ